LVLTSQVVVDGENATNFLQAGNILFLKTMITVEVVPYFVFIIVTIESLIGSNLVLALGRTKVQLINYLIV